MSTFDLGFYKNKHVFVTGHTGFKGSWLCFILKRCGAVVTGYALSPPTNPNLFSIAKIEDGMESVIGDIRDYDSLWAAFQKAKPDIVFHLAAQPLVRYSYEQPKETYETNVLGTVNLLECIKNADWQIKSVVNVTTDKVYENVERQEGYKEDEKLDGYDPYSNSKSCSELVTHSYAKSFLLNKGIAVSTARAGNVIGGGDFAKDRIIPDCVKAMSEGKVIRVRNPYSIRPYQHVLEPLAVYLTIAAKQYEDVKYQGYYNVGPDDCDCVKTGELVTLFCECWGENAKWESQSEENAPHEASFLKLDCSKLKSIFGWNPRWYIGECMTKVCEFSKIWIAGGDIPAEMDKEIEDFFKIGE